MEDFVCSMWNEEPKARPTASQIVITLAELMKDSAGERVRCGTCSIM